MEKPQSVKNYQLIFYFFYLGVLERFVITAMFVSPVLKDFVFSTISHNVCHTMIKKLSRYLLKIIFLSCALHTRIECDRRDDRNTGSKGGKLCGAAVRVYGAFVRAFACVRDDIGGRHDEGIVARRKTCEGVTRAYVCMHVCTSRSNELMPRKRQRRKDDSSFTQIFIIM